jgi:hypothetical protein
MNTSFRQAIYEWEDEGNDDDDNRGGSIIYQLQLLFAHLQSSLESFYSPNSLISLLNIQTSIQQDAQEFALPPPFIIPLMMRYIIMIMMVVMVMMVMMKAMMVVMVVMMMMMIKKREKPVKERAHIENFRKGNIIEKFLAGTGKGIIDISQELEIENWW